MTVGVPFRVQPNPSLAMKVSFRFLTPPAGFTLMALFVASLAAQSAHYDQATEGRARPDPSPAMPPPPAQSMTQAPSSNAPVQTDRYTAESTRFKALDTDGDGRLSRAEFTLAPNHEPITDDTGVSEPRTVKKNETSRRSAEQNAAGANDSNVGSPTNSAEIFEALDTNKDGFLNRAELAAEAEAKVTK
jgi:hypothetical protein